MTGKASRKVTGSAIVLLTALAAVGCGGRTGRVSGTVSYNGRPLPGGTVLLLAGNGQAYNGQVGPDGRFVIAEVPDGTARVVVTSLVEGPASGGRSASAAPSRVAPPAPPQSRIPIRYGDLAQSGLTVTVAGDTALNLDLK